jgi:hypothetical protein
MEIINIFVEMGTISAGPIRTNREDVRSATLMGVPLIYVLIFYKLICVEQKYKYLIIYSCVSNPYDY